MVAVSVERGRGASFHFHVKIWLIYIFKKSIYGSQNKNNNFFLLFTDNGIKVVRNSK